MDENSKVWWQSRTVWTGILSAISALLNGLHLLPKAIDDSMISNLVTVGLGLATIYFRIVAIKQVVVIAPVTLTK